MSPVTPLVWVGVLMAPMTPTDDPDDNHDGINDLDETQPGFWEHVLAADRDDRPWGVY